MIKIIKNKKIAILNILLLNNKKYCIFFSIYFIFEMKKNKKNKKCLIKNNQMKRSTICDIINEIFNISFFEILFHMIYFLNK